ncbi:hypothetical protein, partial [Noviherbaspirillum sp.]|uniref:hypothetical protein n=1 Tax=Noviherbaspirillum sp. TaxID=1926288 RepID=UPI0025E053A5
CALLLVVMLVYPHEILHNQPLGNKGADVQNNSCYDGRRFLRVAASSNQSFQRTRRKRRSAELARWTP